MKTQDLVETLYKAVNAIENPSVYSDDERTIFIQNLIQMARDIDENYELCQF